jgi:hypothetical protein
MLSLWKPVLANSHTYLGRGKSINCYIGLLVLPEKFNQKLCLPIDLGFGLGMGIPKLFGLGYGLSMGVPKFLFLNLCKPIPKLYRR